MNIEWIFWHTTLNAVYLIMSLWIKFNNINKSNNKCCIFVLLCLPNKNICTYACTNKIGMWASFSWSSWMRFESCSRRHNFQWTTTYNKELVINFFFFFWWYPFTAMLNSKSVLKNKLIQLMHFQHSFFFFGWTIPFRLFYDFRCQKNSFKFRFF